MNLKPESLSLFLSKIYNGQPLDAMELYASENIEKLRRGLESVKPNDAAAVAEYQAGIKWMKDLLKVREEFEKYLAKINTGKSAHT